MLQISLLLLICIGIFGCSSPDETAEPERFKILIDTDANNELDDQHALAYAFINSDVFDLVGVTVNNTYNGDGIEGQFKEAERIVTLFNLQDSLPLIKGAHGNYEDIIPHIEEPDFDGHAAVDFIIEQALKATDEKLILVPVGKLTNIALAIKKEPKIIDNIRIVWMGTNYPDPGEYNMVNDTAAVNPVIDSAVPLEIVPARYGKPTASDAVRTTPEEILEKMNGKGPLASQMIEGRNGGTFNRFGDYSINLFSNIKLYGDPPARAMFDMVALAVIKNPEWGTATSIPAPKLVGEAWEERPDNDHTVIIWDQFDRDGIINDFFDLMDKSTE